jgi:hypothetical protein
VCSSDLDVEYAKAAGESGKLKKKGENGAKAKDIVLRAKNIHPDENYDAEEVRKIALYAKFSQNEELKKVLLGTKNAKLLQYKVGKEPVIRDDLILIRDKLLHEK